MLVCLNKNPPAFLDSNPVDLDKGLDIATFDMEPLLAACRGRKFYQIHQNPPRRVTKGDRLFFTGYPGLLRSTTASGVVFGRRRYAIEVSSVDGLCFHSDISKQKTLFEQ